MLLKKPGQEEIEGDMTDLGDHKTSCANPPQTPARLACRPCDNTASQEEAQSDGHPHHQQTVQEMCENGNRIHNRQR